MAKKRPVLPFDPGVPVGPALFAAVRYALPRQTYVTDMVAHLVLDCYHSLEDNHWGGSVWCCRIRDCIKSAGNVPDQIVWHPLSTSISSPPFPKTPSTAPEADRLTTKILDATPFSIRLFTDYGLHDDEVLEKTFDFLVFNWDLFGGHQKTILRDVEAALSCPDGIINNRPASAGLVSQLQRLQNLAVNDRVRATAPSSPER